MALKIIKAVYEVRESDAKFNQPVSSAGIVYQLFSHLKQETKEHFIALHLDSKNRILCVDNVSVGTLTNTLIHPREVYKTALLSAAASIIVLHNHPSGDPTPSREDIAVTEKLKAAGDIIGIALLDHVIIGDGYVSLKEKGYL